MAEARSRADVEFLDHLTRIEQRVRGEVERALPGGLSAAQFTVLGRLVLVGVPESPGALAAHFGLSKGAVTNSLQRLEAQGLVQVASDDADGRRKRVAITAAGLAVHKQGLDAVRPQREALRRAFAPQEFEAALPFLRRLRAFLDASATRS